MASGFGREDASCRMRDAQLAVMMMPPTSELSNDGVVAEAPPTKSFSLSSASEEEGELVVVTVTIVLDGRVASTRVERVDGRNDCIDARRVMILLRPSSWTPSRDPMGGILAARR